VLYDPTGLPRPGCFQVTSVAFGNEGEELAGFILGAGVLALCGALSSNFGSTIPDVIPKEVCVLLQLSVALSTASE